jgi:hypothetical protein
MVEDSIDCRVCEPSGHPRLSFSVGVTNYCGILDTAAEISLVRASVVGKVTEEMKLKNNKQRVQIKGLTKLLKVMEESVEMKLTLPKRMISKPHSFVVVEDNLIPSCFLLGIDYIAAQNLVIDAGNGCCRQEPQGFQAKFMRDKKSGVETPLRQ